MKVVLIQDSPLGKAGEVREVAEGHARNYLFPRDLALPATTANLNRWGEVRRGQERAQARAHEAIEALGRQLEETSLKFHLKAGPQGQVYGAITAAHIAAELERQGISIERRRIELTQPIRQAGSHDVLVRLAPEVTSKLKVEVEAGDGSSQTAAS